MEVALGFLIAFVIAITGVGAGTITAPLLILVLHVPVAVSVGTALAYSTIVKAVVVPVQIIRKQVAWRVLGIMLLGGLPGVIAGSLLFRRYVAFGSHALFYLVLGLIIVLSAAWHLYRHFRPQCFSGERKTRRWAIAALMFPIAAEVGFASSGAGAMGTLVLMGLSSLDAAKVVGTDLAFAFCMTLTGTGMHFASGLFDSALLVRLVGASGKFGVIALISSQPSFKVHIDSSQKTKAFAGVGQVMSEPFWYSRKPVLSLNVGVSALPIWLLIE